MLNPVRFEIKRSFGQDWYRGLVCFGAQGVRNFRGHVPGAVGGYTGPSESPMWRGAIVFFMR
ncbi:MAG: hypothetical protein AB8C95_00515, partial [Phycisphaeraceae bacterium]